MGNWHPNSDIVRDGIDLLGSVLVDYVEEKLKVIYGEKWYEPVEEVMELGKGFKTKYDRGDGDIKDKDKKFKANVDTAGWLKTIDKEKGVFGDLSRTALCAVNEALKARRGTSHMGQHDYSVAETRVALLAVYTLCLETNPDHENAGKILELVREVFNLPDDKADVRDRKRYVADYDRLPKNTPYEPPEAFGGSFESRSVQGCGTLERYVSYGNVAQQIYLYCCDEFGWDKAKADEFGSQGPLWAENAADGRYDPWFICRSNVNLLRDELMRKARHNYVGEDTIVEIDFDIRARGPEKGREGEERIVFVKTRDVRDAKYGDYVFLGIYRCVEATELDGGNALAREFRMISDVYPMPSDEETP